MTTTKELPSFSGPKASLSEERVRHAEVNKVLAESLLRQADFREALNGLLSDPERLERTRGMDIWVSGRSVESPGCYRIGKGRDGTMSLAKVADASEWNVLPPRQKVCISTNAVDGDAHLVLRIAPGEFFMTAANASTAALVAGVKREETEMAKALLR